jgi:uncharacterized protein (DUF362 family)
MNDEKNHEGWSRRKFLTRSAKAGAAVFSAASIGYLFHDTSGPAAGLKSQAVVGLPDYTVSGLNNRICVVKGEDRGKTLKTALKALGGIETFIKKGDRVLLKVNAAFASPPLLSATTHPRLILEITQQCFLAGAAEVMVTDNPINDPASCFLLTGIGRASKDAGAKLILPHDQLFTDVTVPNARLLVDWPVLYDPLKAADKVIGLAPLKDHHRSGASMTMKNWYGLLGGRRNIFHQDIHNIIMELALMIKPTFVVLDATTTMMKNGPTGGSLSDLKQTSTMIVSTDQVAADAFGASLLSKSVSDLPFLTRAEQAGAGNTDYKSLDPIIISEG